ncbi:MAG: hypothetical protein HY917_04285, partial [Candidatus Diapherotrites archaeon]|nr:hypothetical protein [Candidatus Diapherotrites archaeon]
PSVRFVELFGRQIPFHIFFSFAILVSVKLLTKYDTGIARTLFFTVLFGFLSLALYSVILNPVSLRETFRFGLDIVINAVLLALFGDCLIEAHQWARERKRGLFERIKNSLGAK